MKRQARGFNRQPEERRANWRSRQMAPGRQVREERRRPRPAARASRRKYRVRRDTEHHTRDSPGRICLPGNSNTPGIHAFFSAHERSGQCFGRVLTVGHRRRFAHRRGAPSPGDTAVIAIVWQPLVQFSNMDRTTAARIGRWMWQVFALLVNPSGHCIVELTEKFLIAMGGWQAFKEARALHAAGRVLEASYEPPLLKGKLTEGGKSLLAGLKLRNAIDVENLCLCRDSRVRGIICAHSLAVGLQVIKPVASKQMAAPQQSDHEIFSFAPANRRRTAGRAHAGGFAAAPGSRNSLSLYPIQCG